MKNESGIIPIGDRVLVRVEKVEERTKGGIILPTEYQDKKEMAQLKAVVIANGEIADQKLEVWPQKGDTVLITKYAGQIFTGKDEQEYRVVNCEDITAILEEPNDE